MERRLDELAGRIEELTGELRALRRRLEMLESQLGAGSEALRAADATSDGGSPPAGPGVPQPESRPSTMTLGTVPLIGRTLVVLGGAFLLRAISDSAVVPTAGGAAAGLAYAAWWLVQADRNAAAGMRQSAVFHGFATAMIAYPLIWETTARFEVLSATTAALALLCFLSLGLAVAWRREIPEIAWTITLFTVVAAIGLVITIHAFMPIAIALLLAAVPVETLAFRDRLLGLRWPVALGSDLGVLMLTSAALSGRTPAEGGAALAPGPVIGVCLALPLLYLCSIGARTLFHGRPIGPFAATQSSISLLVGFSGAVRLITKSGQDVTLVGVVALILGAACYAIALTFIDRRLGRGRNFYFYTTLASLLVLTGSWLILGDVALALTWSTLALVATGAGGRFNRITLKFHGAVYVAAAAVVSGILAHGHAGFFADPTGVGQPVKPIAIGVALVAAACYAILVATRDSIVRPWFELLPQAIVGAVVVWSVAGITAGILSAAVVAAAGADAAFVAANRTMVIAILAVVLAWAGRRWSLRELTWFVYPILIGGGFKLLWEDFHYDRPIALFLVLAFYGSALIITPRLTKKAL